MSWRYIYLNIMVQEREVVSAISQLFHVKPESVKVVMGEPDLSTIFQNISIVCGIYKMQGEFPFLLEVTPLQSELLPDNDYKAVLALCEYLRCDAVITDGEMNPYKWILIRSTKKHQYVLLESELLDKEDDFEILIKEYLEEFEI